MSDTNEDFLHCDECGGKGYIPKGSMVRHERPHTCDKPFWCRICNAGFRQRFNLMRHLQIHTGIKPYSCEVCGKCFALKANVKLHMRIHTGEKPFQCKDCHKGFRTSSNLKTHQRTHTGEKPFTCVHCGRGFSRRYILAGHIRTHTVEDLSLDHVGGRDIITNDDLEMYHSSKEPSQSEVVKTLSGCATNTASKKILMRNEQIEVSGMAAANLILPSVSGPKTKPQPHDSLAGFGDLSNEHVIGRKGIIIKNGTIYEERHLPKQEIRIVTASSLMKQSLQAIISMELPGEEYLSELKDVGF